LTESLVRHDSFHHAMAVMTALYSENLAAPTGDQWIDQGILKPKPEGQNIVRVWSQFRKTLFGRW
jgi:hypothetical protein